MCPLTLSRSNPYLTQLLDPASPHRRIHIPVKVCLPHDTHDVLSTLGEEFFVEVPPHPSVPAEDVVVVLFPRHVVLQNLAGDTVEQPGDRCDIQIHMAGGMDRWSCVGAIEICEKIVVLGVRSNFPSRGGLFPSYCTMSVMGATLRG